MNSEVAVPPGSARNEAVPNSRKNPLQNTSGTPEPSEARHSGREEPSRQTRPSRLPSSLVGLRVLVVDDDEDTVELFAAALSACGATVTTATNAVQALHLITEVHPDVVLSDIAMARGDGYWLVGEIKRLREEALRRVPVVAATAFGREHSHERVLAAGFADHLQKPVDPEVLCRTIARAAGR
jgi:CheY-like chemotaxis protein